MANPSLPVQPLALSSAGAVVGGAYDTFGTCAMSFDLIAAVSRVAMGQQQELVRQSSAWGREVFCIFQLVFGLILLFAGTVLVKPINVMSGLYLGNVLSLLVLTLFAPLQTPCAVIVGVPVVLGFALAAFFWSQRGSTFAVIGLVLGEILGTLTYELTLEPLGAPDYLTFTCIGFFSVVLGVMMWHIGDVAWMLACAFMGAYIALRAFAELVLVPYVPMAKPLAAFVSLDLADFVSTGSAKYQDLLSLPISLPLAVCVALGAIGMCVQYKLQGRALRKNRVLEMK